MTLSGKVRLVGCIAATAIGIAALIALGNVELFALPRSGFEVWLASPVSVLAVLTRLLALGCAVYLFVLLGFVLFFAESPDRLEMLPRWTLQLLAFALGVGLAASPLSATSTSGKLTLVEGSVQRLVLSDHDARPRLIEVEPGPDPTNGPRDQTTQTPSVTDVESQETKAAIDEWTVQPGDSFWLIAAETLADRAGHVRHDDTEIAIYWRTLIHENIEILVEPGNPDLLLPGQVLQLPASADPVS